MCISTSTSNCTQTLFWIWWFGFFFDSLERKGGREFSSAHSLPDKLVQVKTPGQGRWCSDPCLKGFCLRAKSSLARGLKARKQIFLSNTWGGQKRRCLEVTSYIMIPALKNPWKVFEAGNRTQNSTLFSRWQATKWLLVWQKSIYLKETSARESGHQVPPYLKVKLEINCQSLILTNKIKKIFTFYHPLEVSWFRQIFLIENQQYYCSLQENVSTMFWRKSLK